MAIVGRNKTIDRGKEAGINLRIGQVYHMEIDCGKDALKALKDSMRYYFKMRVRRLSENESSLRRSADSMVVEYEGETYIVGDELNTEPNLEMSKTSIEHKICIYVAIAQMVENYSLVKLALGFPMLLYLNDKARLDYVAFMSQSADCEWIEIVVDQQKHCFKIKDIRVLPESSGFVFSNFEEYGDKLVGVIDVGGLNVNGCVFDCLNPVFDTGFTINHGGHHLRQELQQRLVQRLNRDIQHYQLEHILKNPLPEEEVVIEEVVKEHLDRIKQTMKAKKWDLTGIKIVLTGGTSHLLARYAEGFVPSLSQSEDPIWDNVTGFQNYVLAQGEES